MDEFFPTFWITLNKYTSKVLFHFGTTPITSRKIILTIFAIWFFNYLAHFIEKALHRTLMRKDFDPGAKTAIERFTRYGVFTAGLLITLTALGINTRSLETFGAVLGVGIGFGLQSITQNFISGLILLTERPIKRGDLVDVNGVDGRILDIRARSTLLLTRDDIVIVVPNSDFITKPVVNQSFSGEKVRYAIDLTLVFGSKVSRVQEILLAIAEQHESVLKTPPPVVEFKNFGTTGLDFCLRVWLSELWFHERILSEIRFEIFKKLEENNIKLATKT
jgi:small-conductance mechanosensitive channel